MNDTPTKAILSQQGYVYNSTSDIPVTYTGNFPYEPQMQRVILDVPNIHDIMGVEEEQVVGMAPIYRKKGSKMALSEKDLQKMVQDVSTKLIEAKVVAVGHLKEISLLPGDKVMIFLNQLEASIVHEEKEYRVFPERCIITKVK